MKKATVISAKEYNQKMISEGRGNLLFFNASGNIRKSGFVVCGANNVYSWFAKINEAQAEAENETPIVPQPAYDFNS